MSLREKLKWLDPFTYVDVYVVPRINPGNNSLLNSVIYLFFAFVFAFILYNGIGFLLNTPSPLVIVVSGSMEPFFYRGDVILLAGASPSKVDAPVATLSQRLREAPYKEYVTPYCSSARETGLLPCTHYLQLVAQQRVSPRDFTTTELRFANNQTVSIQKTGDVIVYYSPRLQEPVIHRVVAEVNAADGVFYLTKGDSINNPLIDQEAGIAPAAVPANEIHGKMLFKIPLIGYVKLILVDGLQGLLTGCYFRGGCKFP